ncbi:MAG: hypothetical protein J5631_00190 [Spirochaetaceae bacterium]|nr:hypothetical protein [Spirochaetaceae bacterium]
MIAFLNIFMIPVLSVALWEKKQGIVLREIKISLWFLIEYIMSVVGNILFSKSFVVLARKLGKTVVFESTTYTVIALISCVLVYVVAFISQKFISLNLEVRKREE